MGAPEPAEDASTPDRILDAAHRVFLRRGTAGARTQEIAAEAGVNKALVHYYFGTKAALRRGVRGILDDLPDLAWLVLEGGGPLADIWEHEAEWRERKAGRRRCAQPTRQPSCPSDARGLREADCSV